MLAFAQPDLGLLEEHHVRVALLYEGIMPRFVDASGQPADEPALATDDGARLEHVRLGFSYRLGELGAADVLARHLSAQALL